MQVMDSVKRVKRIFIGIVGITILLIGILLLFIPGPGIVVIFIGLAILASEFLWIRRKLKKLKMQAKR